MAMKLEKIAELNSTSQYILRLKITENSNFWNEKFAIIKKIQY